MANYILDLCLLFLVAITSYTDIRYRIIPDSLLLAAAIAAILLRLAFHPLPFWQYPAAGILAGLLFLFMALIGAFLLKNEALGGGDIKLAAVLGLYIGIGPMILSLFITAVLGLILGFSQLLLRRFQWNTMIPFGPILGAGSLLAYITGDYIFSFLINHLFTVSP